MNGIIGAMLLLAVATQECVVPERMTCGLAFSYYSEWEGKIYRHVMENARLGRQNTELYQRVERLEREYQRTNEDLKERYEVVLEQYSDVIRKAENLKKKLSQEYGVILRELENGEYCSKCNKTKHQIDKEERAGFYNHVRRVKARIERAPESVIAEKRAEYNRKQRQNSQIMLDFEHKVLHPYEENWDKKLNSIQKQLDDARAEIKKIYEQGMAMEKSIQPCRAALGQISGTIRDCPKTGKRKYYSDMYEDR